MVSSALQDFVSDLFRAFILKLLIDKTGFCVASVIFLAQSDVLPSRLTIFEHKNITS